MKRKRPAVATPAEGLGNLPNSIEVVGLTPEGMVVGTHPDLFELWGKCTAIHTRVCLTLGEGSEPDCLQVGMTHLVFPTGTKFE